MKPRRRSTWLARAFPPTAWMAILAAIVARVHAAPEFRAGADRSDITPALGTPIPGGFTPPNATHVHDPLHVRSLVLDDGATRIAFVVCDDAFASDDGGGGDAPADSPAAVASTSVGALALTVPPTHQSFSQTT